MVKVKVGLGMVRVKHDCDVYNENEYDGGWHNMYEEDDNIMVCLNEREKKYNKFIKKN